MESFIADVMSGVTDIEAFITRFCRDAQFREEVDLLLPREAIGNREHEIWRRYSYDAYAACGFSCSKHICELCKFDHSIGDNLNIFRQSMDQSFRKQMYKSCLDIIVDWAVEIPVYQRQNAIIFSTERVNLDTVTPDITTYYGWLQEIENVELN